jgi:hypothetical protein
MKKFIGMSIIGLGIISCLMFFVAGIDLGDAGEKMTSLRSQAGTSLAEDYYQNVGYATKASGKLCFGLGLCSLGINLGLGIKYIKENELLSIVNQQLPM